MKRFIICLLVLYCSTVVFCKDYLKENYLGSLDGQYYRGEDYDAYYLVYDSPFGRVLNITLFTDTGNYVFEYNDVFLNGVNHKYLSGIFKNNPKSETLRSKLLTGMGYEAIGTNIRAESGTVFYYLTPRRY